MNKLVVVFWGATIWLSARLGQVIASLSGWLNWELLGWAFAGSTAFVVWEAVQETPPKRTPIQRAGMVLLGLFVSLLLSEWVAKKTGLDDWTCAGLLGAAGYKLFGFGQKKADKPDETIKDITGLNEK